MDTLVLDVSWQPVARVSWERAVTLWFEKKVEVVAQYEDWIVRSVSHALAVPSVIRFLRGVRSHRRVVKFSRENVYLRDGGRCQYCGNTVARDSFTYDHVLPRAQGGKTTWDNVVVACDRCNSRKADRTPTQAGLRLLSTPVKPSKLSGMGVFRLRWQRGMPASWKDWLASDAYWNAELEEG